MICIGRTSQSSRLLPAKDSPDGNWYFKHINEETTTARDDHSDKLEAVISQQLPPGYSKDEQESRAADEFYRKHHRPLQPTAEETIAEMGGDEARFDRGMPDTARLSALLRGLCQGRRPDANHPRRDAAYQVLEVSVGGYDSSARDICRQGLGR